MIRVRPAQMDDLSAISAVWERNGMSAFNPDDTRRWWLSHPFRQEFEGVPIGWVLEHDDGSIVGTFSNVHMMYELDGQRLKCGVAGSWAVDAPHRNSSLLLAMSYFKQKDVDLCINGSASGVASKLMTTLKAQRIHSEDYDLSYFWIVGRRNFAAAALKKKRIPVPGLLAYPVALGLWATERRFRGAGRVNGILRPLESFGPEFDEFWETLRRTPGRLRAVRTAAALDWRYGGQLRKKRAVLLGLFRNTKLAGYIVLLKRAREHLGIQQFLIGDMQALDDSREVLLGLLEGALGATRTAGLDALEWQGWNPAKRALARTLRPKSYRYPVWPLFYKTARPDLIPPLKNAATWDFSPFDAF